MRRWRARKKRCTGCSSAAKCAAAVLYVVSRLHKALCWGCWLRAYGGLLRQPAVAGRDHSASWRILSAGRPCLRCFGGRRCGRVPGAFCGPRGGLGAGVRHGASGPRKSGAARGLLLAAVFPLLLRRAHRRCTAPKRGAVFIQERTAQYSNRRKLFFKPEPLFADGAKDRNEQTARPHGRAVFALGRTESAKRRKGCGCRSANPIYCCTTESFLYAIQFSKLIYTEIIKCIFVATKSTGMVFPSISMPFSVLQIRMLLDITNISKTVNQHLMPPKHPFSIVSSFYSCRHLDAPIDICIHFCFLFWGRFCRYESTFIWSVFPRSSLSTQSFHQKFG